MRPNRPLRVRDVFKGFVEFVYRRPWLLAVVPFAVFLPLLDSRGLYEYGDANFPLNPFWIDYILPWSGAASAGADNTFIGVPRLVYLLVINLLIGTLHNLQVAQWIWYSSITVLGLMGAFALARRLGAGLFSVPLALFYAMNVWSYDRVAQGPIYLSYQAMPLAIYLFLRYLKRPRIADALYFSCSLLLVIPALQISYLTALVCAGIAVREVVLRGPKVLRDLAWLVVAVVAANAFYVFSMLADALFNAGGNIAFVNQRFSIDVFKYYSANVSLFNTLTLQSFFYSSIGRQLDVVRAGALLIPLLLALLFVLMRRPVLRSKFYAGLALALLGVWLVAGIAIAPGIYQWFHYTTPGMRSFVEPDYFSPIYIIGVFVMFAAAVRMGARAYGALWSLAVWFVALSGVLAFLPINGPASGLPQTAQPRQYTEFSRSKAQGNTLWIPPIRGVQYRWSPYVINGFTSLNSPSDAIGPTMAEWVSPGTARIQNRLAEGFMSGQLQTVRSLAPLLGVGTVAIAADSTSEDQSWPNPKVNGALSTLDALRASGDLRLWKDDRGDRVHLVTATTAVPPLPELGVFGLAADSGGFDQFMWRLVLQRGAAYAPTAADEAPEAASTRIPLPKLPPPKVSDRSIPVSAFDRYDYCSPGTSLRIPRTGVIRTDLEPRCLSIRLRSLRDVGAIQATLDAQPLDVAQLQVVFAKAKSDVEWLDPTVPAQEVPVGVRSATVVVHIPPESRVAVRGIHLRLGRRSIARSLPAAQRCEVSDVNWSEQNPMQYTLEGNVRGLCTIVFRQSFAPIWTLVASGSEVTVLRHLQVDGFANAWIVRASGPVRFTVVNGALYAYVAGMMLTLACILLAATLAIRDRVRWAARRASRLPSTA